MAKQRADLTVEFKNVTPNKNSISAGFDIVRDEISLEEMDELFTGRAVSVTLKSVKGDVDGQRELIKGGTEVGKFKAESMGFVVRSDHYSVRLKLAVDELNIDDARKNFTFRKVKAIVVCTGTASSLVDKDESGDKGTDLEAEEAA